MIGSFIAGGVALVAAGLTFFAFRLDRELDESNRAVSIHEKGLDGIQAHLQQISSDTHVVLNMNQDYLASEGREADKVTQKQLNFCANARSYYGQIEELNLPVQPNFPLPEPNESDRIKAREFLNSFFEEIGQYTNELRKLRGSTRAKLEFYQEKVLDTTRGRNRTLIAAQAASVAAILIQIVTQAFS